jgi:hypothetical protein
MHVISESALENNSMYKMKRAAAEKARKKLLESLSEEQSAIAEQFLMAEESYRRAAIDAAAECGFNLEVELFEMVFKRVRALPNNPEHI